MGNVCSIITDPVTTTSSSILFVIDEPVQSSSTSTINNDEINAIKNNICGGIQHLIHQTNQGSDFADLSIDPNLSQKCFILQVSSYLKMIQELVTDLINDCDHALQGMPTLETKIDKIHLSELITNYDPSLKKKFSEAELRYLINEGPYQPLLTKFPDNESLKQRKRQSHFTKKWYQEYPLIEYSPVTNAVYCFCCRLFGDGPESGQQDAWSTTGIRR